MARIRLRGERMEEPRPRRRPAVDKKISEIKIGDERVRVVGFVIDKKEGEFVLDDGTGQISVFFDDPSLGEGISVNSKVRVFGTPLSATGSLELRAEIVQKVDRLDLALYEEVRREIRKLEKELEG